MRFSFLRFIPDHEIFLVKFSKNCHVLDTCAQTPLPEGLLDPLPRPHILGCCRFDFLNKISHSLPFKFPDAKVARAVAITVASK